MKPPITVTDRRSTEQKSITAHIDHWTPPLTTEDEAEEEQEAIANESEVNLPQDVQKVLALQAEVQSAPANDRFATAVKKARLAKIALHLHALNQAPTPPPIVWTHDGKLIYPPAVALEASPTNHTPARASAAACIMAVKKECCAEIASLKAAVLKYVELRKSLREAALLPGEAARCLEQVEIDLGSTLELARVEELLAKKLRLNQISHAASISGVRQLTIAFDAIAGPLQDFESKAEKSLDTQAQAFIGLEKEWFASFGLARQVTAISDCAETARARVRDIVVPYHNFSRGRDMQPHWFPNLDSNFAAALWS
jgi:beta-glucosidase-like glycosyl hydrolase